MLRRLWDGWLAAAHALHGIMTVILFGLVYLLIVPPFALILQWTDPLRLRRGRGDSYWIARQPRPVDLAHLSRQG